MKTTWLGAVVWGLGMAAAVAAGVRYVATPIVGPEGSSGPMPLAVNSSGVAVGYYFQDGARRVFRWSGGTLEGLGGTGECQATDINDDGIIVGRTGPTGDFDTRFAFVYEDGEMRMMSPGPVDLWDSNGLNNNGVFIAQRYDGLSHGMIVDSGEITEIGCLEPTSSSPDSTAYDINDAGQVAGSSPGQTNGGPLMLHAVLFDNGVLKDIGTELGTGFSEALALNDDGAVVGYYGDEGERGEAFLYQDGKGKLLGRLKRSDLRSEARDINNAGQVVGICIDAKERMVPFLYEKNRMIDLNSVTPLSKRGEPGMVRMLEATAINEKGQIVGTAEWAGGPTGEVGVLLTPVEEAGVSPVTFSPEGGTFDNKVRVRLDSATKRTVIRYTTDGSEPTEDSPRYRGAIKLKQSGTITAKAYREGYNPSATTSAVFVVGE